MTALEINIQFFLFLDRTKLTCVWLGGFFRRAEPIGTLRTARKHVPMGTKATATILAVQTSLGGCVAMALFMSEGGKKIKISGRFYKNWLIRSPISQRIGEYAKGKPQIRTLKKKSETFEE